MMEIILETLLNMLQAGAFLSVIFIASMLLVHMWSVRKKRKRKQAARQKQRKSELKQLSEGYNLRQQKRIWSLENEIVEISTRRVQRETIVVRGMSPEQVAVYEIGLRGKR